MAFEIHHFLIDIIEYSYSMNEILILSYDPSSINLKGRKVMLSLLVLWYSRFPLQNSKILCTKELYMHKKYKINVCKSYNFLEIR